QARLDTIPAGATLAWTAAAYQATLGDTTLARRWLRILDRIPTGPDDNEERAALRTDVESRLAARAGHEAQSLTGARQAYEDWGGHSSYSLEIVPELAMRWRLAELLRSRGLVGEAEPLYRSLCPPYTWVGFYTALSGLALGEIEEGRRHPTEAAHYYRMAARLWERGEPGVVGPWLARAEEGLRRVGES
ncbi:MAG TPA: hypothetical protein VNH46_05895, partial [Gemmatimonadales bacterium]|nr:hypothetical protein [Gemmatimonadales bacterium]